MLAEIGGKQLKPQEFGSFVLLLVAAGNDRLRSVFVHGVKKLPCAIDGF
ncbi:MAG: hypothetical protein ACSLFA_16415 [Mycobacterium sp.]